MPEDLTGEIMEKRILVTGGAGFIGRNLCSKLLSDPNNHVLCVDNFYSSRPGKYLHEFKKLPNFEFLRHDITYPLHVEVDEIYNLASPASPIHYQRDPVFTMKTNVMGMINMLGLAKRTRAKILQASTSEVYGDPLEHPQKESYWGNVNPIGPRSNYDEGKRAAETLCFDYYRQHSLDVKIVRIFNTFGIGMWPNDGRVVSNFIVQALQGNPITVNGDGLQTRSFCYVDDLVRGLISYMNTSEKFPGPINLGNPNEITMLQLAEKVIELTDSSSQIVFQPLPVDDPVRRRPDISLAWEKLRWEPKVSLDEGLKKTCEYFSGLSWSINGPRSY